MSAHNFINLDKFAASVLCDQTSDDLDEVRRRFVSFSQNRLVLVYSNQQDSVLKRASYKKCSKRDQQQEHQLQTNNNKKKSTQEIRALTQLFNLTIICNIILI